MNDNHQLSGAYALDALDDIERARFEQHLVTCADCRTEVDSLREAAALLSETTLTTPPPSLRESVLAGISQVRPLPPIVDNTPATRPGRRWFPLLVAAAVMAIFAVGSALWQPWAGDDPATLSATEQVLQAPDARKVFVDLGEAGRATLVRSESTGKAVLVTEDMVAPPTGKVYELWLQHDGEMVPAGLMPPGSDQEVLLNGDAAAATAAGITVEPEGGSEAPTTDPIVVFDFSQAT